MHSKTIVGMGQARESDKLIEQLDESSSSLTQAQMLTLEEDLGLPGESLDDKYNPEGDGEHPLFTRAQWREAVAQTDTISGYWTWCAHQISSRPPALDRHNGLALDVHPLENREQRIVKELGHTMADQMQSLYKAGHLARPKD